MGMNGPNRLRNPITCARGEGGHERIMGGTEQASGRVGWLAGEGGGEMGQHKMRTTALVYAVQTNSGNAAL